MRLLKTTICYTCVILTSACSPKIKSTIVRPYDPLAHDHKIWIIPVNQPTPEKAKDIGTLKIGDSGFSTKCGYQTVIANAKIEARKAGGNAIKLTQHKTPNLGSTCHKIEGNIILVEESDLALLDAPEQRFKGDYALLHIYRLRGLGSLLNYNVYLNDTIISRVKNNFKTTVRLEQSGEYLIYAKTEKKIEVPINVEFGRHYYLRCGVKMGAFVGHPKLELVDWRSGKVEFESFKAKKNE